VHKSGLAGWQITMMVADGDVLDPNGMMTEESRRIDVGDFHLISSKTQTPDFSEARSHTARGVHPTVLPKFYIGRMIALSNFPTLHFKTSARLQCVSALDVTMRLTHLRFMVPHWANS
jgi:hypothetical protein